MFDGVLVLVNGAAVVSKGKRREITFLLKSWRDVVLSGVCRAILCRTLNFTLPGMILQHTKH